MIVSPDASRLSPADKASIIYAQAHASVETRLWRAALGTTSDTGQDAPGKPGSPDFDLDTLLSMLAPKTGFKTPALPAPSASISVPVDADAEGTPSMGDRPASTVATGLGPNARYRDVLDAAATRTGIPAAALAAIVDAEAAKGGGGSWNTASRNPRSSAAGLGQFLGGTWQSEAERAGTWLNQTAVAQGWIGDNGKVLPAARSALLALRYDGAASINATADYAYRSVTQLKSAGIAVGDDIASVARAAYLGHHLGTGDAVRFLKGGLDSGRARVLLDAQIGTANANARISRAGDAASAHRSWLLDFVARHVDPARFSS